MEKLKSLWKYQEAELILEELEAKIRNTQSRIQLAKLRTFLTDQQKILDNMSDDTANRITVVEKMSESYKKLEEKFGASKAMLEKSDSLTLQEVEKARKSLESLLIQITDERRELYNTLQWVEQIDARLKNVLAKASKAKKEYDVLRIACEKELEDVQPKLQETKDNILKIEKEVDKDLLKKYKSIKRRYPTPVAKVENNQCGGCNMGLPMAVARKLKDSETIVECENCGRILYVP